jgi:transcriptional regulator with XRE-family HTH domain
MVPKSLGSYWTPLALPSCLPARDLGEFIRRARKRSGLSFREASKRTRFIAQTLRDARYFCAPGSLSDFETRKSPPRHIHKLVSICAVYFASAADFLEAAGVQLDRPGQLPMPRDILEGPEPDRGINTASSSSKCMKEIERRFQQLPYFLHRAMSTFFGIPDLSIRDVFWSGGVERFVHPYMDGAAFLVIDRKKKIPRSSLSCPKWAQPLYVFLQRDGRYLCGSCTRLNGVLMIHPCMAGLPKLLRLRNRTDAEVVGQVVGIVRRLK